MDPWDNNTIQHQYRHRRDHRNPSFSSTLLDHIYRSTDDSSDVSMRKKHNRADENRVSLEKIIVNRRKTADDFVRSSNPVFFKHSTSSSSDSSVSSSSSDSFYKRTRSSRSPPEMIHHPKPIRTTTTTVERPNINNKAKSKAMKMYSDLKKVKQPISPGGRLATFINSLFNGGNAKKPNNKSNKTVSTATSSTTCSSASSFSRSCLSKTTSSSEKSKRSVRFCPVNVILDEDYKRGGINNNNELIMEENRRVIEAAKELIRTYRKNKDVVDISGEDEDDDDDGASCASSDLFELDNLSSIGIERYREELPVYETTRLNTKRIISR